MDEHKPTIMKAEELLQYQIDAQESCVIKKINKEIEILKNRFNTFPFANIDQEISIELDGKLIPEALEKIESNLENIGYSVTYLDSIRPIKLILTYGSDKRKGQ